MCGSMVDIQFTAAEVRRGKKIEEERKKDRKKETTGQKYNGPLLHRAAIRNKYYKQRLEWRFGLWFWLWVKVFIRERELTFTFAICCRPFVCRLPVVCNVQSPYSAGWNFRQCFYTISYIGHPLTSTQYFTDIVPVEPLHRRVLRKRGSQNSYFGPVEGYISEMVQDMSSYDKLVLIINRKSYIWAFD